ncbi:MAG: hypothetical protein QG608_1188, partial [Actinomycetota bacterium]|nr:hypothetical protein [Actinomycetota bacterium]
MLPRSAPAASALPAPTTLPAPTAQQNAPTTPQNGRGDPVVLLGTAGLRWEDADAGTPTLRSLLSGAATGVITVRSLRDRACPADGWLAVSAGRRAADEPGAPGEPGCRVLRTGPGTAGGEVAVPRWETYRREAAEASFDAEPGTLGRALARGALTSAAIGPGAQIALADGDGRVSRAWPGLPADAEGGIAPRTSATELKGQVAEALALGPDLLAVDLGTIVDPPGPVPGSPPAPRADQVRALDARLRLVLGELPENSTVVVASLASGGEKAHLQLGAVLGPVPDGGTYSSALLTSRSTRQSGLVQSTDVTPTLLEALDLPRPAQVVGSPLRPTGRDTPEDRRWQRLVDLDLASQAVLPIVPWFFTVFVSLQFLVLCALVVPLRRAHRAAPRRPAVVHGTRWFATACAAVPAAAYLANLYPWWRSAVPEATLPLAVLCATVPLTAVALLGPWRSAFLGPPGAIGALTALVLGADALSGSQLMLIGLIGEQPLIAGRFYGFGNPAFALFASGALLAALALADGLLRRGRRRAAVLAVVIIGLLATVLDGTPGIGSDFGGPPAMIPAFGLLAARTAGVRLSLRRIAALGGLTLSAVLALSLLDHSRPAADRTHLGAFVATALDGGAWPVIRRKALQNLELLMTPPAFLLPVAVLFVALVLYRPLVWRAPWLQLAYERSPLLRSGVAALGVLVLIGFAM